MMNTLVPNTINIRVDQLWVEDAFQKNHSTGAYERVGTGGEGGNLPEYIKPDHIDMVTSKLTNNELSFGESVLDKTKVDTLSDLKTKIYDEADVGVGNRLVSWHPTLKTLVKNSPNVYIFSGDNEIYFSGSNPLINVRFGATANINTIGMSASALGGFLRLHKGGVVRFLYAEDIDVTNKLKALTSATAGVDSKMLIYDTSSKAFNYTDIPSSGGVAPVLPYYLKTNSVELDNPAAGTPQRILCKENYNVAMLTPTRLQVTNGYAAQVNISTTTDVGGYIYLEKNGYGGRNLTAEDVDVTNKLKALTPATAGNNSKMMMYNESTKAFNYSVIPSYKNKYIKYSPTSMNQLPYSIEAAWNVSTKVLSGYDPSDVRRFYTMNEPGDTLYIDLANYWTVIPTIGYKYYIPIILGVNGAVDQSNAISIEYKATTPSAITQKIYWGQARGNGPLFPSINCFIIELFRDNGGNYQGTLKLTLNKPDFPGHLTGIIETSPTLN